MTQIMMPTVKEKKDNSFLGQVGKFAGPLATIAGAVATGGAALPIGLAAGGIGLAGALAPEQKQAQALQGVQGNAMQRRMAAPLQDGDTYSQLKQGLLATTNLSGQQQAQFAPTIIKALQKTTMG